MLNILLNLRPVFDESKKIAFTIGTMSVAWYAIIIMLGAVTGTLFGYFFFAKKLYLDSDTLITGMTLGVIFGILGARLYYVLFNFKNMEISSIIDIISPRGGGLAIHGAVLAEFIFLPIFCKKKKVDLLLILEIAMPLILFAQVVGRWGNFINQEAFGSLVPFTGEIKNGVLSDAQLLEQRELLKKLLVPDFVIDRMYISGSNLSHITNGIERIAGYYYPTFYFESVANFIGLTTYMVLRKFVKKIYVGDGLCFYLTWYGFVRFFIELIRTDPLTFLGIRVAVLTSIIYFIVGITLFILRRVFKYRLESCQYLLHGEGRAIMERKVVVFDCDGTILDTFKLIEQVVIKTFNKLKPDYPITKEEAHTFFGPLLNDTFKKYFDTEEEVNLAVETYREFCDEMTPEYVKAYDGIKDMLESLTKKGYVLAIVSNKVSPAIMMGLKLCEIDKYFSYIVGAEKLKAAKPDPDGINQVLYHFRIKNTVLVGDTLIDLNTSKNANVDFIGVTWCQTKLETFKGNGANYIAKKPSDIIEYVNKIYNAKKVK